MRSSTFPGRNESLAAIGAWVRQAAQDAGLDSTTVYTVETSVDEACSNIIEHAYGGENRGDIECTCWATNDSLTITLRDHGIPFNPDNVPEPDISASLDDRLGHGLGLYFMRQWMDEVRFDFSIEEGNTLTMIKHKRKEGKS
jgi:serine/threonine-protein kinase RsbW